MSIFKDEDSVYRNSEEFQSNAADPKSITKPIHVMGKIIDIKMKGLSHPAQITVLYRVGKQSFLLYVMMQVVLQYMQLVILVIQMAITN